MTLRLSLVIEGDAKGAAEALTKAERGIAKLGRAARDAQPDTRRVGDAAEHTARSTDRLSESTSASTATFRDTLGVADLAAGRIKGVGDAALSSGGALSGLANKMTGLGVDVGALSTKLATFAGGVIGGVMGAAFGTLAGEAVRWIMDILDHSPSLEERLKSHASLIGDIAKGYRDAAAGVHDYREESAAGRLFAARQNVAGLQDSLAAAAKPFDVFTHGTGGHLFGIGEAGPFLDLIKTFNDEVKRGEPNVIAFRKAVAELAAALPEDSPFVETAAALRSATEEAATAQAKLEQARDIVRGLTGDTEAMARALGTLPKGFEDAGAAAERAAGSMARFRAELESLGGSAPPGMTGTPPNTAPAQFAAGGVIDRPTLFAYGGGRLGLMGEAGPEAIMPLNARGAVGAIGRDGREHDLPLARLASGKLGVKAFAAGGTIGQVSYALADMVSTMSTGTKPADAFVAALGRIADALLQVALNNLLTSALGGSAGGILGALGFAKGGVVSGRSDFVPGGTRRFAGGPSVPIVPFASGGAVKSLRWPIPAFDGSGFGDGGTNVSISIPIDASGADPAAVTRLTAELARLKTELPVKIVDTVRQARSRKVM